MPPRPFREVPIDVSFPALERQVLARWQAERTFERSVEQRQGARPYVFYDGPPFATGLPHYGHILTSYIKDVVPRYFAMRGYHVPRRWGWDCHGLPVEFEIEKELGFRSRADIVAYGVDRFNDACRAAVLRYAGEWRRIIDRLGRWVDFDDDYKTMDPTYMESVVWAFKSLFDKGLIYEGDKVVPYCIRCQTTLSNFESRMDDAMRPRQDPAVTVRFRRRDGQGDLLAWTTTPWTLPSNVALAVGPDIEYLRLEKDGDVVWIAAAGLERYQRELGGYRPTERRLGRELAGVTYEPLMPWFSGTPEAFRVLTGDFVTTEDGTGVVHLAPAFGEDDSVLCAAHGIVGPNPVGDDGRFDERVVDFAGQAVFEANPPIITWLKERGALVRRETCDHNYPHCWRCDSPLIYRGVRTWFVRVLEFKDRMVAANRKIRWVPEHVQGGLFGNWLENARDWAISRNRFWGAPIPVWRCDGCGRIEVIGSAAELTARTGRAVPDWHRPAIDGYAWPCPGCPGHGTLRRVSDVLDCWFESGSMPYAQVHYPFERKLEFERSYPGDFIVEYVAQTRGWFYTLVVLAAALFDERPFRDGVCHGVILAEDGRKMSKRLKNYPDPMAVVEEHGSDALRIALLSSAVVRGGDVRFAEASVRDAVRRLVIPLWNSLHYFTAYAAMDGFLPPAEPPDAARLQSRLDRYLLSETETLRARVEERMAVHDYTGCYEALEDFITMLSTWYLRLSKQRFWRSAQGTGELDDDKRSAYLSLHAALSTLALVAAPFLPFVAESVHESLGGERSVHLEDWPAARPGWVDHAVAAEMSAIRTVVRIARSVREDHKIKHRHPLRSIAVAGLPPGAIAHNLELLRDELNVKEVGELASLEEHARAQVKLDYGRLGRRLRGEVKKVQAAIDAGSYQLSADGRQLSVAGFTLSAEDFSFRYAPRAEHTGVAAADHIVVVLDLTTDEALLAEGAMRDLNRGLQDLRKKARLAYGDRVEVSVVAGAALEHAIDEHRGWLMEQVLARSIVDTPLADPLAAEEIEVGDETVRIALRRA